MGVLVVEEFEEMWKVWQSVMGLIELDYEQKWNFVNYFVEQIMWLSLEEWKNYVWQSGGELFVNMREIKGVIFEDDGIVECWGIEILVVVVG